MLGVRSMESQGTVERKEDSDFRQRAASQIKMFVV
jgi:hypothetical protein